MTNYDVFVVPPLAVPHQKPPNKLRSHLYPIFLSDATALQVGISGSGYILSIPIDDVLIGASISGTGELRSVYQTLDVDKESTSVQASISGIGKLQSVYQTLDIGGDSTSVQANISGTGELKRVLITYDNRRDDITIQASISGVGVLK